jgi:hypothetical protein
MFGVSTEGDLIYALKSFYEGIKANGRLDLL